MTVDVDRSDLDKIYDVLDKAYQHHASRDASKAMLHLAPQVRYSPLTSELSTALDRLKAILENDPMILRKANEKG